MARRRRYRIPRISRKSFRRAGRGFKRAAGPTGDVLKAVGAADIADDITAATGFNQYSFIARLGAGYLTGGAWGLGAVLVKDLIFGKKIWQGTGTNGASGNAV